MRCQDDMTHWDIVNEAGMHQITNLSVFGSNRIKCFHHIISYIIFLLNRCQASKYKKVENGLIYIDGLNNTAVTFFYLLLDHMDQVCCLSCTRKWLSPPYSLVTRKDFHGHFWGSSKELSSIQTPRVFEMLNEDAWTSQVLNKEQKPCKFDLIHQHFPFSL